MVRENLIYGNSGYGIQVAAYDYKPESMAGPEYAEAKGWTIARNTIALEKSCAGLVLWQDGVEDCRIEENIFYRNAPPNGIVFYTQKGRRHLVRRNVFWPPGENLAATEEDAYRAVENREVDPEFVDPERFDFRLKPGSPALGAGAPTASGAR